MQTYTDEQIEQWARVYHDNHLSARNIRFDTFMLAPEEILLAARRPIPLTTNDEGHLPLLPSQIEAMKRFNRQSLHIVSDAEPQSDERLIDSNMEWHGDAGFIQPLHHRSTPRYWKTGRHTK